MLYAFGLETLLDGEDEAPAELQRLAAERDEARAARDFERADPIRDELAERGWEIRDTAGWPPASAQRDRLRAQPRSRGAAREAAGHACLATEKLADEVWLGGCRG